MYANTDDFSFSFTNEGLGPAIFQRVRFGLGGKCHDSDDQANYRSSFDEFTSKVADDIYRGPLPKLTKDKHLLNLPVTSSGFDNGTTVRPASAFEYIKLGPQAVQEVLELEGSVVASTKVAFSQAVSKIPLSIAYCSATGFFCDEISTDNDVCALSSTPARPK
jgi:hypothetical protein